MLVHYDRISSLWRDIRGQLLLTVQILALVYLLVSYWLPEAFRWLIFNYLVLAFCGLLLVLQPVPGTERDRHRRAL